MKINFVILAAIFMIVGTMDFNDQAIIHANESQYSQDYIDYITLHDIIPCDTDEECHDLNPQIGEGK